MKKFINNIAEKVEKFMELGGIKKEIAFLIIAGVSVILSFLNQKLGWWNLPFDVAWVSVILCGIPMPDKNKTNRGLTAFF